jgi:Sulfotransferase family
VTSGAHTDRDIDGGAATSDCIATNGEIVNPYVFVVGAARSGTTLLQRMLDAHPQLAVVNETYWVARKFRERDGLTREGIVTPALLPKLVASPKFSRMGVSEEDLLGLLSEFESVHYDRFVARIFDLYAARRGKQFAGDKTPGYVRSIRRVHGVWPRARFVHIVRDPRDVCLSMLEWHSGERTAGQDGTWDMDPVTSIALYWRHSVAVGREAAESLGPGLYQEVRYEDLVSSPERELKRICKFLCLPYAEEMTRFYEGKSRPKPGRSTKAQWLPPTPGLRDWRTQLPTGDVERVEVAVGHLLHSLGYAPRFDDYAPAARSRVQEVRETFTRHLLARGRTLPQDW